jgi:hypothetical protein
VTVLKRAVALTVVVVIPLIWTASASAAQSPNASCVGAGSSALAPGQGTVTNPLATRGGSDAEDAEALPAIDRIPDEVHRHDRTVMVSDFRELAEGTPGAGVGRGETPRLGFGAGRGFGFPSPPEDGEGLAGYPGIRADIAHFAKVVADELGTTPGQLVRGFAQQKGLAEECFPEGPPLP